MTPPESTAEVSVIGLGRVGLPLALSLADRGLRVIGIDNDPAGWPPCARGACRSLRPAPRSNFERVTESERLSLSERVADAAQATQIVITLGPPRSPT